MENKTYTPMWTKSQLTKEMVKARWEPGTVEGIFVHRETQRHIDINDKDSSGAIIWITYAMARMVPPPF